MGLCDRAVVLWWGSGTVVGHCGEVVGQWGCVVRQWYCGEAMVL